VECKLSHGMIKSMVLKLKYHGLWSWSISVNRFCDCEYKLQD